MIGLVIMYYSSKLLHCYSVHLSYLGRVVQYIFWPNVRLISYVLQTFFYFR